jgi:hypothetical protein
MVVRRTRCTNLVLALAPGRTVAPAPNPRSTCCDRHHGGICLVSQYPAMGGDSLMEKHLCPACGGLMGLTRTIAASPGYRELRTYGCRECGVWVTEGGAPRDRLKRTLGVHKRGFPRD